jgi:hypothetical protein
LRCLRLGYQTRASRYRCSFVISSWAKRICNCSGSSAWAVTRWPPACANSSPSAAPGGAAPPTCCVSAPIAATSASRGAAPGGPKIPARLPVACGARRCSCERSASRLPSAAKAAPEAGLSEYVGPRKQPSARASSVRDHGPRVGTTSAGIGRAGDVCETTARGKTRGRSAGWIVRRCRNADPVHEQWSDTMINHHRECRPSSTTRTRPFSAGICGFRKRWPQTNRNRSLPSVVVRPTASTRARSRCRRPADIATRSIFAMWPDNLACSAGANRPIIERPAGKIPAEAGG